MLYVGLLAFLGSLFIVVIVHEAGHALVATRVGMRIKAFYVGIPPLVRFTWLGIPFRVGFVPFGGAVALPDDFDEYPIRKRVAVTIGGVAMGLVSSIMLLISAIVLANFVPQGHVVSAVTGNCNQSDIGLFSSLFLAGGLTGFIYLTGVLGIAINLFNILPLPGLDGGRLVVLLIERVFGRRLKGVASFVYGLLALVLVGYILYTWVVAFSSFATSGTAAC